LAPGLSVVVTEVATEVDHTVLLDHMGHMARGVIQANQVRVQKVVKDPKERAKSSLAPGLSVVVTEVEHISGERHYGLIELPCLLTVY